MATGQDKTAGSVEGSLAAVAGVVLPKLWPLTGSRGGGDKARTDDKLRSPLPQPTATDPLVVGGVASSADGTSDDGDVDRPTGHLC